MLDPRYRGLSLKKQCKLLNVSRSSYYYRKQPVKQKDSKLMKLIDEQYLKQPSWGSRSMTIHLKRLGYRINRKRVQRLMRKMGLEAIYPRPRTSKPHPDHKVYPYLLRGIQINRPNQVWCSDITYIPMASGFMYLVAIMDWYSRKILSWQLSNTLDTDFCLNALEDAVRQYGCPEIFNTDQGCQFTSQEFTGRLENHNIKISMDGRGCYQDNIFIERLWWTLKHQYLYLHAFDSVSELKTGLKTWFRFYNQERFHRSLDDKTPDEVCFSSPVTAAA